MMKYTCWPTPESSRALPGWALALPVNVAQRLGYNARRTYWYQGDCCAVIALPTLAYCQAVAKRAHGRAIVVDDVPMEFRQ